MIPDPFYTIRDFPLPKKTATTLVFTAVQRHDTSAYNRAG